MHRDLISLCIFTCVWLRAGRLLLFAAGRFGACLFSLGLALCRRGGFANSSDGVHVRTKSLGYLRRKQDKKYKIENSVDCTSEIQQYVVRNRQRQREWSFRSM